MKRPVHKVGLVVAGFIYRNSSRLDIICESYKSFHELCNTLLIKGGELREVKILSHLYRQLRKLKFNKMNTTELKGNWNEQKGKLKQKFAVLTDDDLMFAEGKSEELYGRLQIKLGKSKEELKKIISEL